MLNFRNRKTTIKKNMYEKFHPYIDAQGLLLSRGEGHFHTDLSPFGQSAGSFGTGWSVNQCLCTEIGQNLPGAKHLPSQW